MTILSAKICSGAEFGKTAKYFISKILGYTVVVIVEGSQSMYIYLLESFEALHR